MKKAWDIFRTAFTWLVVVAAVLMMIFTVISVTTVDRNNRSLFGYKIFKVMSDSMKATDFAAGDVILSREVDASTLQEGDIITFVSWDNDTLDEVITHKIKRIVQTDSGRSFVTYGTTTGVEDATMVTEPQILGKYVGRIPKVGYFFQFLQTVPGYICCILIPFMFLILSQAVSSIRLFKRYKREQTAELEAEKQQVASEREEMQRMMADLMTMKQQLANSAPQTAPEQAPAEAEALKAELSRVLASIEENTRLKEKLEFAVTLVEGEKAAEVSEKLQKTEESLAALRETEKQLKAKLAGN